MEATANGTLTLLDKLTSRSFEHLHRLEDEPDAGDLYNSARSTAPPRGAASPPPRESSCVGMISRRGDEIATRPVCAGPPTQTPDGQCLGRHILEYALVPGADALDDAELLRAAHDYRYGFLITPQAVQFEPPLRIEGDVVFSCLKGAEDGDGLILRCFNPNDWPASASIAGDFTVPPARLDEAATADPGDETGNTDPGDETGNTHPGEFELGPGEIATFRLRPRAA